MKYLVIGAKLDIYNIDGESNPVGFVQMINLENNNDDGVIQGYQPVRVNLKNSAITIGDFKEAPGIYEIETKRVPNTRSTRSEKYGKQNPKGFKHIPYKATCLKKITFPNREEMLVLGSRQSKTDNWRGITAYLLDTVSPIEPETDDGKAFGLYIVEETFENWSFRNLPYVPGWYEPEFKSVRDSKGEELERIVGLEPVEQFTIGDLA
jgi:hypothetical protein